MGNEALMREGSPSVVRVRESVDPDPSTNQSQEISREGRNETAE